MNRPIALHYYRDVNKAIQDKKFQEEVERDESLNFLLRDTISLTMLGGSQQTNVIPPEAWANLDVRILPGGDPKPLAEDLRRLVNDPNVTIEPINAEFRVANYSGTDNAARTRRSRTFRPNIFRARLSCRTSPAAIPRISATGLWASWPTDSVPYTATEEEGHTEHGNDERIRVEEVRRGPEILIRRSGRSSNPLSSSG